MANLEAIIGAVEVLREELPKLHGTLNYAGDVGRFHGMQNMTNENVVRLERLFQVFVTAQDHTNEQLLQQQRDLMDRIRNLEGALMVGRATYTFLSSDCNGSGTHSMDSRTQDYPSPESMVLSLPREDVSMSENSFAEESDEETLRKLQEELMGMPESTKDIIDMISDARHISPEHERGSTKSGVQTPTVHRSPVSSTKGSRSSSVRSASHRSRRPHESIVSHAVITEERSEPGPNQPTTTVTNPFRRKIGMASTSESLRNSPQVSNGALRKAPVTELWESASHKAREAPSQVSTRASTPVTNVSAPRIALVSPRTSPQVRLPRRFSAPSSPALTSRGSPPLLTARQQRVMECIREMSSWGSAIQGVHIRDIVLRLKEEDDRWTASNMLDIFEFLEENNYVISLDDHYRPA